jgi:hypothetical protein
LKILTYIDLKSQSFASKNINSICPCLPLAPKGEAQAIIMQGAPQFGGWGAAWDYLSDFANQMRLLYYKFKVICFEVGFLNCKYFVAKIFNP